jgi:hypothetical protein
MGGHNDHLILNFRIRIRLSNLFVCHMVARADKRFWGLKKFASMATDTGMWFRIACTRMAHLPTLGLVFSTSTSEQPCGLSI